MKTASKVFLIIGMVLACFLIYPIIIGILAIKKIDEATDVSELKTFGWLSIFLVSPIGGILMLGIKQEELQILNKYHSYSKNYKIVYSNLEEINQLYILKEKDIISEREYNEKKKKILEKI